jgi:hypothetical protein
LLLPLELDFVDSSFFISSGSSLGFFSDALFSLDSGEFSSCFLFDDELSL